MNDSYILEAIQLACSFVWKCCFHIVWAKTVRLFSSKLLYSEDPDKCPELFKILATQWTVIALTNMASS